MGHLTLKKIAKKLTIYCIISSVFAFSLFGYCVYLCANPIIRNVYVEVEKFVPFEVEVEKIIVEEKEIEKSNIVYVEKETKKELSSFSSVTTNSKKYSLSAQERDTLARLLYLEAGSTSIDCQKKVMSVVFNIYDHNKGKMSFTSIVYKDGLFSPAARIPYTIPTQTQYDVVDWIVENGSVLPKYVMSFRAGHYHNFQGYAGYCNVDNVYFGYFKSDKN